MAESEIRGDILLDRLLGFGILGLTLLIVPIGMLLTTDRSGTLFSRYAPLALTFLAAAFLTRSTRPAFWTAIVFFAVRGALDAYLLGAHPGNRFISSACLFDAVLILYCVFRLRALAKS